jgi:hypothetical protein
MNDEVDLDKAWGRMRSVADRRVVTGEATAEKRSEREKPPIPKTDGRRKRATGRTAQLKLKVKAESKTAFHELAKKRGMTLGELLEEPVNA